MKIIGKSKRTFIAPKPPAKVYCKGCRYYRAPDPAAILLLHECSHPTQTTRYDTPIRPEYKYGDCCDINADNNCKLFSSVAGNEKTK